MMCFGVGFFIFLSLGIHWALWICGFEIFIRFGKFLPMIFSNLFLDPIFFRDSNYIRISMLEVVLWLSNALCVYFGGSPFSPDVLFWMVSIALFSSSLIFLSPKVSNLLLPYPVYFCLSDIIFFNSRCLI